MKVTNGSVEIVQPIFGATEKSDFCDSEQVGENDSAKTQIDDSTKSNDQVGDNESSKSQFDNQVVNKDLSETQFDNQVDQHESAKTQKFDRTKHDDDDYAHFTSANKKTSRFPPEGFV